MEHIFKMHSISGDIVSDMDPIFCRKVWQVLFSMQGVTLKTSTEYYPQTEGQTKIANRCLETYLRCNCADSLKDWAHYLVSVEWWYTLLSRVPQRPLLMRHCMDNFHPCICLTYKVVLRSLRLIEAWIPESSSC